MNNINIDLYSAVFDRVTDKYLMHYGTPLMKWRQHGEGKRWQSHAVYAQGKPNPNARVRGDKELDRARNGMSTKNTPFEDDVSDSGMVNYPKQSLKDLHTFNGKPTYESRLGLNHPPGEDYSGPGLHYNCPNCAAAFDMHERGYDVVARTAVNGSNVGNIEKMYEGGELRRIPDESNIPKLRQLWKDRYNSRDGDDKYYAELERQQSATARNTIRAISSQGLGARGTIVIGWMETPDGSKRATFYHAFNYKNEEGGPRFYDVQSGKKDNLMGMAGDSLKVMNEIMQQGVDPREVFLMRTDNLEPTEAIMSAVYSPDRSRLQHSEETGINVELYSNVFDRVTDKYLMHYGTPLMKWRQHGEGKRWQSHAVYAQGKPNPNGRVRGKNPVIDLKEKKKLDAREKFKKMQEKEKKRAERADHYPKQTLTDLKTLDQPFDEKYRVNINHPKSDSVPDRIMRYIDGNCPCCSASFEMSARGYDVIARRLPDGLTNYEMQHMFKGGKFVDVPIKYPGKLTRIWRENKVKAAISPSYYKLYKDKQKETSDKTLEMIEKQGDGARGFISLEYQMGPFPRTSLGHVFNYVNENGKVKFYDVQIADGSCKRGLNGEDAYRKLFRGVCPGSVSLMRTDNLEPTNTIMRYVYSPDRSSEMKHSGIELLANTFDSRLNDYLSHSDPVESATKAYEIICNAANIRPVVMSCRDYKDYFGFYLAPPGTDKSKPFFVGHMIFVDKRTGKIVFEEDLEGIHEQNWQEATVD